MKICAVRDSALNSFMTPFAAPTVGAAVRSFGDEARKPDCPISSHPSDYELYELADYDPETGRIKALEIPVSVARAVDYVASGQKKVTAVK